MALVNTIRGPIDTTALGRTLSHEHITSGGPGMERLPWIYDGAKALQLSLTALKKVKDAGIQAIIDLTPLDLGRQMGLFQELAEADPGVHIVCATGVYRWIPFYLMNLDPDDIADHFLREITDGIEGTGIRAGIIKLAWDLEYHLTEGPPGFSARDNLERTARGAARAAKAAGVPISCHTRAVDKLGTPMLDLFEDEGLDLRAVTIGHSNDTDDLEYLKSLLERGTTVGLDRYSHRYSEEERVRRARLALTLADHGYAERVSLGHDSSPYMRVGKLEPYTDCWLPVPTFEVPWLRQNGATEDVVDAMLCRSVAATFEAADGMKNL